MYVVVAYDVVSSRRRAKLARRLDTLLRRVQKSVFEGELPDETYAGLKILIQRTVDLEVDTVRIYHVCGMCRLRTNLIGDSPRVPDRPEDVTIGDDRRQSGWPWT